jgi:phosphoglycerate-specific signal transduction histidine kinase
LVKVVLVLAVIAALGFGGYLGIRELGNAYLDLSAESVETAARVELLRSDVNTLMENDTSGRRESNAFQNDLTALDGRVSVVEREMTADLERQTAQLAVLEARLDEMVEAGVVISENVALLNGGIAALQTDIVGFGSDLDSLGGEVDGLQSEVAGLDGETVALQASLEDPLAATEDVAELRQILVLFRVWELVARARLRLVEGNPGLALADVQTAQGALSAVIEASSEEMAAVLTPVQQRLDLAAASLPNDPITAARDLETAWEALDGLLSELLGLPVVEVEEEGN